MAVIGGGPGGSSAATALARRGRSVLLLERDRFPRFHIGESQLPWINGVLGALGVDDAVAEAGFVEKWGASFSTADGARRAVRGLRRARSRRRARRPTRCRAPTSTRCCSTTPSARRRRARGAPARVDAAFDADGVDAALHRTATARATARVPAVVDASGRAGLLARRIGRRRTTALLRNVAVHAQYEGVPRRVGPARGRHPHGHAPGRGLVLAHPDLASGDERRRGGARRRVHAARVAARPRRRASSTTSARRPPRPRCCARARARLAGALRRRLLLPRTRYGRRPLGRGRRRGAFLDPIFSTGVLLAMQAGLEAAEAIDAALARRRPLRAPLRALRAAVRRRYHYFRRFVVGFYDPAVPRALVPAPTPARHLRGGALRRWPATGGRPSAPGSASSSSSRSWR